MEFAEYRFSDGVRVMKLRKTALPSLASGKLWTQYLCIGRTKIMIMKREEINENMKQKCEKVSRKRMLSSDQMDEL